MIVITGAAGFIGSVLVGYLNSNNINDLIIFDDLPNSEQYKNLSNKKYYKLFSAHEISNVFQEDIQAVVHLGANSNTLEKNWESIYKTNVRSTREWHDFCKRKGIPFIFSSSAAVYGNGTGPLNQYAFSKKVSEQEITNGVILRLFNVYGPNEYHKGRMASTIFHWYNQIQENGIYNIFQDSKFYRRDFIWVEDIARVIQFFIENYQPGVYDLGSGKSTDFESVADLVASSCKRGGKNFIPMPSDLEKQYQKETRANLSSLQKVGFDTDSFKSISAGVKEYIDYLSVNKFY